MTIGSFDQFIYGSAQRIDQTSGAIGHLVCTQEVDRPHKAIREGKVREPEMLTALQVEADRLGYWYGVEAPTEQPYIFKASTTRGTKARMDFVLLASEPALPQQRTVSVELKADIGTIGKDIEKFCEEPFSSGWCLLHLCHGVGSGTKVHVLNAHNRETASAIKQHGTVKCD